VKRSTGWQSRRSRKRCDAHVKPPGGHQ
jgi:hypothetical protein